MAANYTLRKITESSWIAHTNGTPVAFIHKGPDYHLFVTKELLQKFPDMKAIEKFLGGKIKEQIVEASDGLDNQVESDINGFPVKHQNITIEHAGDRPVYLRGKTQHAAGYWCIKFSKRWVPGFCPLLKTVEQYQSMGPFKSRLEMMTELAAQNRSL
jgi:hypothetical protein